MAHIRTKAELDALDLTEAEVQLIEACQKGETCILGDGELPEEIKNADNPDPARHIRADVLRYQILGGCDDYQVDEIGVWVKGAHITGTLDLGFCAARGAICLLSCRFVELMIMEQTHCKLLNIDGSHLCGLYAPALQTIGNASLRDITTSETIDVCGAIIGGQLAFKKALFEVPTGKAVFAQNTTVTGDVFFNNIVTNASIDLSSATIGGQLVFFKATLDVIEGYALFAQSTKTHGGLVWVDVSVVNGQISFTCASVTVLADDSSSWPIDKRVDFDGTIYDRILGGPTDAKARLYWLQIVSNFNGDFFPQPYTQLAKVLRDMGHDSDARLVLEKREQLLRKDLRKRWRKPENPAKQNYIVALGVDIAAGLHWLFFDQPLKHLIGYGHRPFKSLVWLFAFWALAVWLADKAWEAGDFAPASAVIQATDEWQALASSDEINPAQAWSIRKENDDGTTTYVAGQDWSTFNRYAYAADLVIPIIDLGQTDTWGPSTERGIWGKRLWRYGFLLQIAGWIVTALGAAAITGLIRRD